MHQINTKITIDYIISYDIMQSIANKNNEGIELNQKAITADLRHFQGASGVNVQANKSIVLNRRQEEL